MLTFQKYVHFIRTQFPPGSRVLLLSDGTMGTLKEIDSAGRFLVNWDTGKRTALNLEDDHFRIFQPELMELKLFSMTPPRACSPPPSCWWRSSALHRSGTLCPCSKSSRS